MILGTGVDLVSSARLAEILRERGRAFEAKVFTPAERAYAAGHSDRVERLAGRFAAKEAVMKALGTGWAAGVSWKEIEVKNDRAGRPLVALKGRTAGRAKKLGIRNWHLSISHADGWAVASVVAEGA